MMISKRLAKSRPLATTAMHSLADRLKAEGRAVIDFSIAISHLSAPASVRSRLLGTVAHDLLPYTAVAGLPSTREALATKVNNENGIDAKADNIIVTNGAKQALYEALYALTDPGDQIILFRPYWPTYLAAAQLLDLRVFLADLPATLTPSLLESLPSARVIIVNNPHNPTGKLFSQAELTLLANWLERRECRAIVDECYEKLIFDGEHCSLASLVDWRALGIVTLFSASQSYAMMGWRAGFAVGDTAIIDAMETLQGPITAAPSALTQAALEAAFAEADANIMLDDYRIRRNLVCGMLAPVTWMHMHCPASGPYLWIDVRALGCDDTEQFAQSLLKEMGVALIAGNDLGMPGWIRIGYIAGSISSLIEGIAAIIQFGNNYLLAQGHSCRS